MMKLISILFPFAALAVYTTSLEDTIHVPRQQPCKIFRQQGHDIIFTSGAVCSGCFLLYEIRTIWTIKKKLKKIDAKFC